MRKAVVLLSGGLDSTTTLAIAREEGFSIHALTFRYGQRHEAEIEAARRVASHFDVSEHVIAQFDLRMFGGSALTSSIAVPKGRAIEEMSEGIPVTYVPARNTVFLSLALAWAEATGSPAIVIGVNALDYSGYPDCRPEYIEAFERLAALATKAGVGGERFRVLAPLLRLTKGEIIREGLRLGLDYGQTHSCYAPRQSGAACGACDSCRLRAKGFADAGVPDPAIAPSRSGSGG